jgi:hypothetical protein
MSFYDATGQWHRTRGDENWEFDELGHPEGRPEVSPGAEGLTSPGERTPLRRW